MFIFTALFFVGWQKAVIGLMIFSASFGFIASILAVCGVCTSPLPKKIYYFHSAGEIFLVCGKTKSERWCEWKPVKIILKMTKCDGK